jgi:hypothetical protein
LACLLIRSIIHKKKAIKNNGEIPAKRQIKPRIAAFDPYLHQIRPNPNKKNKSKPPKIN